MYSRPTTVRLYILLRQRAQTTSRGIVAPGTARIHGLEPGPPGFSTRLHPQAVYATHCKPLQHAVCTLLRATWHADAPPRLLRHGRQLLATGFVVSVHKTTSLLLGLSAPAISASRHPSRHPQMPPCNAVRMGSVRSIGMRPSRTAADEQAPGPSRWLMISSFRPLDP